MISVIDNIEGFKNLKSDWDEIYLSNKENSIFQSFDYNYISWITFLNNPKNKLYILTYKQSEGLRRCDAIFPLYLDKIKRLRFINDIHTDFCDGLISQNAFCIFDIIYELYGFIEKDKNIKFVFLDNIRFSSNLLKYMSHMRDNIFIFSQTEYSYIYSDISKNPIDNLKHLTSKKRKKIVNKYNDSLNFNFKIFNKNNNDKYPKEDINQLIKSMISKGIRTQKYFNPELVNFCQKLYDKSLIEVAIMYKNNLPACAGLIFINNITNEYIRWIILYQNPNYNLINSVRHFVETAKRTNTKINFGRGGYKYRMNFFKPKVEPLFRLMYSKTLWGNLYIFFKINISHLRKTLNTLRK